MLRFAAAGSIGIYQQYVSPYKGFRCAYHALTGRDSCSQFAKRLVLRHGVIALWRGMPAQFMRCRESYRAVLAMAMDEDLAGDTKRDGKKAFYLGDIASWGLDCGDCSSIEIGACDF